MPREGPERPGRRATLWAVGGAMLGLVVVAVVIVAIAWPTPAGAVDGLLAAIQAGDPEGVRRRLDARTSDELARDPERQQLLFASLMPAGELRYRLRTERRTRDRAIVRATLAAPHSGGRREATLRFVTVREPDGWKVDMAATLEESWSALGPAAQALAERLDRAGADGAPEGSSRDRIP